MNLLLILLLNLSGGDVDVSALEKIAIQDDGRIKPFDTFARECLDLWTGKQSFQSFKDPSSGEKVKVFSSPNATVSILELISDPEGATSKKLIKIQHPELKKKLGFTTWSHYFSMDELQLQAETLRALYDKAVGKPSSERGPLDRAVLSLARSISLFEQVVQGVPLRIVPLGYGQMQRWVSIFELQNFLEAGENWLTRTREYAERFKEEGSDLRYRQAMAMVSDVESCIKVLSAHPRNIVEKIFEDFNSMVGAFSLENWGKNVSSGPTGIISLSLGEESGMVDLLMAQRSPQALPGGGTLKVLEVFEHSNPFSTDIKYPAVRIRIEHPTLQGTYRLVWHTPSVVTATYAEGENKGKDAPLDILSEEQFGDMEGYESFSVLATRLGENLRKLNPEGYPTAERLGSEVKYNQSHPFQWTALLYAGAFLIFLFSIIFTSRILWGGGILFLLGAIGIHFYSYMWRWEIADRFPLSNQYEAMLALALLGAVIALIFEVVMRSKYFGLCAGLIGALMILLADLVTEFSPFIKPLPPALQSLWMTIHVPTVLMGYVCGAIMAVLGHIFILTYIFAPGKKETLKNLENYQYKILQVTVLFLLVGIVLGGIWAKEAWGRFWGWDMKETWALITLLAYLAVLHMRMARAIGGFGLSVASIIGASLVFLTFYGVNYVFGKGLHTYGFGEGSQTAMFGFFALEAMIIAAATMVHMVNKAKVAETPKD